MYSPKEKENKIRWYINFYSQEGIAQKWRDDLHALLSQFEKGILSQKKKVNYFVILKSIISGSVYNYELVDSIPTDKIFFWPFQFLHCDFMKQVMGSLKQRHIPFTIIVFRKNLVKYLSERGESAVLVHTKRKLKPTKEILRNLLGDLKFLLKLLLVKGSKSDKNTLLATLFHTSLIRTTEAAAHYYLSSEKNQYHFIGYDLSVLGRILIRIANEKGIANGRIQNGAPNYLLSGYSEVQQLFLWDDTSRKVYEERGYNGEAIVVGNLLLQAKKREKVDDDWLSILAQQNGQEFKDQRCVFIALSGAGHNTSLEGHLATLELIEKIVISFSDVVFLIKLHPKDHMDYFKRIRSNKNAWFTQDLPSRIQPDALDILAKSQFLITGASSVALDAFTLGIKVISIDPLKELNHFGFIYENEAVTQIYNESELNYLKDVFSDPMIKKNLENGEGGAKIMKVLSNI